MSKTGRELQAPNSRILSDVSLNAAGQRPRLSGGAQTRLSRKLGERQLPIICWGNWIFPDSTCSGTTNLVATVDPFGLFIDSTVLNLERVILEEGNVTFHLRAMAAISTCPACRQSSSQIHSRYRRLLSDLPAHGGTIRIELHVRRFFCTSADCSRQIFTERLPNIVASHARTTSRLHRAHRDIGMALGGEAGSRLAGRLSMPTSPDTLLRRVREAPVPHRPKVRVLGVDDWAFRKGHNYGMILCDLEQGRPIDLLPVRSADALCDWLKDHPEVEIISRDRGDDMIRGASAGAPQAEQVADRWHLLRNLRDALVGTIDRHRTEVRQAAQESTANQRPAPAADNSTVPLSPVALDEPGNRDANVAQSASRARRLELYEQVRELRRQGLSIRKIADRLKIHKETVERFLAADTFPEREVRHYERGTDAFVAHLKQRWSEGCRNATLLFQELQTLGFLGSYYMVRRQLALWRKAELLPGSASHDGPPTPVPIGNLSSRRVTSMLLNDAADQEPEEQAFVEKLKDRCPELKAAATAAQEFATMVRDRNEQSWEDWLAAVLAPGGVKELRAFAEGLKRDEAAVRAALRLDWSNGPVEGAVNRLKTIKRQMYGRANFDLLRQRVLLAA